MGLQIISQSPVLDLHGQYVFLSASIPDASYHDAEYDPLEITEAVVAATRSILSADGRLLFGAHPAISPLVLRVARDFKPLDNRSEPRVIVYQSALYENLIPEATWQLQAQGLGELRIVPAEPGEEPKAGRNVKSLEKMRSEMISNDPIAAIFIGGKEGISKEYEQFIEFPSRHRERPTYIFGAPGGEARRLAYMQLERLESWRPYQKDWDPRMYDLTRLLASSNDYYSIMDYVQLDLVRRQEG